jgi:transcriptional regulator with XRE-family HTH domain
MARYRPIQGDKTGQLDFELFVLLDYVANQIFEARVKRRWSQQELAVQLGVDQGYVSRLENGQIDFQLSMILRLSAALGGEPTYFVPDFNQFIEWALYRDYGVISKRRHLPDTGLLRHVLGQNY